MKYAISYYLITVYEKIITLMSFAALLKSPAIPIFVYMLGTDDAEYVNRMMDNFGFLIYAFIIEVAVIIIFPSKNDLLTMLGLHVFEKPIGHVPEIVEKFIKKQLEDGKDK